MKLWLLRPVIDWDPWYDKAFGFVIRAGNEQDARELAESESGYESREGVNVWLDETKTTCIELSTEGDKEIVIRDFAAA